MYWDIFPVISYCGNCSETFCRDVSSCSKDSPSKQSQNVP
ncbi:hypothetical protein ES1_13320 [[Eubacterium] siraeum V10Sc8a]|uniref:Uncharacterized protein n=1 Tax=[Eubacterium] siraeum V10Sc8a TaxID=717961 RepID=D4MKN4_9FIRM|nr:hypothetical protein ES1_13320 [[Eubacterium] siraeum V10Sc8a]